MMKDSIFLPYRISVHNLGYPETRELLRADQELEKTHKGIELTATALHKFLMSQDSRKDLFQDITLEILISSEDGSPAKVHSIPPEAIVTSGVPVGTIIAPYTKVSFWSLEGYADARKVLIAILNEQCNYHEVSDY